MSNQKIIALIPARLAATRLPGKLLKKLGEKSVIQRTYEAVVNSQLFDDVIVVCDEETIEHEIQKIGGKTFRSLKEHESGTDRIAEAAADLDAEIVVNIQGDEPFINIESLRALIALFKDEQVKIGSLMLKINDLEKINNPNCVKVVVDASQRAMYFSRSAIPYYRDENVKPEAFQHIGVYAFRKETLLSFTQLPMSRLEKIEKLENLRMLEHGIPIHLAEIKHVGISIDTEEDYQKAIEYLNSLGA